MQKIIPLGLVFLAIFIIPIIVSVSAQSQTLVHGNFPKLKDTTAILSYSYVGDNGEAVFANDTEIKNGKFEIILSLNRPTWINIRINNENLFSGNFSGERSIIVIPADSIVLDISDYGYENIIASGRGTTKFDFIATRIKERIIEGKQNHPLNPSIEDNLNYVDEELEREESRAQNFCARLKKEEYTILLAKKYVEYYDAVTRRLIKQSLSEEEYSLVKDTFLHSDRVDFLRNLDPLLTSALYDSYYVVMNEIAYLDRIVSRKRRFTDDETNDIVFKYKVLRDYYDGYKVKDNILGKFLIGRIVRLNIDKPLEDCIMDFLENADPNSNIYKMVLDRKEQSLAKLSKGLEIDDYSFIDSLGQKKFISDFKGKVMVLDFWFNRCYGCALITPQLNDIKECFEGKDVTFVSINIDKNKETWLSGIGKFAPLNAVHLNTFFKGNNHPMIKYFQITALPTLVIIDKQGRIFSSRATRPYQQDSKGKLMEEIEEALSL